MATAASSSNGLAPPAAMMWRPLLAPLFERPKGARLRRLYRKPVNPQVQVRYAVFPRLPTPEPFGTDRIPFRIAFTKTGTTMHHCDLRVRITRIERNIEFLHHRLQLIPPSRQADLQYTKTQLSVLKRCLKLLRSEHARMGKGLPVETPIRKRRLWSRPTGAPDVSRWVCSRISLASLRVEKRPQRRCGLTPGSPQLGRLGTSPGPNSDS